MIERKAKHTNRLINESSPYLLQHAHNPVDWHPWSDETLAKAREHDKMLLVSIGYSACHWCHVMERESFENEVLADIMNKNFICVKVDREERPDVDAVFMNAVQLIQGNGGWPLNCFALPDGRPFYGGTYFPPQQWEVLLKNVSDLFRSKRPELEEQASQVLEGIRQDNLIDVKKDETLPDENVLREAISKWKVNFDMKHGGSRGAPKFPMPTNYQFLLEYAHRHSDHELMQYVELTLDKMAMGGIYDQLGGGFARYSVDAEWKVPHFEKMLYDNAQMVSLYTSAFQFTGKEHFLEIACETADFVLRELTSPEGAFYAALDADSEGEEGKFYIWTRAELNASLGGESDLMAEYFEVDGEAHWEKGKNVLMRKYLPDSFAEMKGLDKKDFATRLHNAKKKLLSEREKRVRPGLDDKSLTSWNAMMIKALAQLHMIAGEEKYLNAALKAAELIRNNLTGGNNNLMHSYKNGKPTVTGFLEDYAHTADAAIELYQVTMEERWIKWANGLVQYAMNSFFDKEENMFWFTDMKSNDLVARKKELYDNVIPASNSVMGHVLFRLSKLVDNTSINGLPGLMAKQMMHYVKKFPSSFSNWARLIFYMHSSFKEIVITGPDSQDILSQLYKFPYAGKILAGAVSEASLPVFEKRFKKGKNMVYVCSGHVCKQPVDNLEDAIQQLK